MSGIAINGRNRYKPGETFVSPGFLTFVPAV